MKLTKFLLTTTTALGLSVTTAFANGNDAFLDQNGDEHSALIEQSGDNNDAGGVGSEITQNGHRNNLDVLQSGNDNSIGLGTNSFTGSTGILQTHTGIVPSDTRRGNSLSIVQSSNGNTVGAVDQDSSTQGNNTRNSATITQAGDGGNEIDSVRQRKNSSTRNTLNATQEGRNNLIAGIFQNSNVGGNGLNTIDVYMAGTDNGHGALSGFAADTGATTSSLIQDGRGNSIDLDINGRPSIPVPDENQFGITQLGNNNTVNTVTLDTKRANLGIYQDGNGNEVAPSTISGNDNTIGILQIMDDNLAAVTVAGTGNSFLIDQNGVSNDASVTISGNNNGDGLVFGDPLSGSALTASLADAAWERGVLRQFGDDNFANLTQFGNGNMFGTLQKGNSNIINGTQDGMTNQVAVVQVGMTNTTGYSQVGSGNNAGIVQ